MQENTNIRKWSSHVSFNRLEMSDAQAKMKDLGFKTLPQLVRHTIEILDTPRAVKVQELEKRVSELCSELYDSDVAKTKAETSRKISDRNEDYWKTYAIKLGNDRDELTEQLSKETVRYEILNGSHNVEMEKHNRLKDLACEYREARDSFEKRLLDVQKQFADKTEVYNNSIAKSEGMIRRIDQITDMLNEHFELDSEGYHYAHDYEKAIVVSKAMREKAEKRVGYLTARIEILHELAYANVAVFLWRRFHGLFKGKEKTNEQAEKETVAKSEQDK